LDINECIISTRLSSLSLTHYIIVSLYLCSCISHLVNDNIAFRDILTNESRIQAPR